MPYCGRSGFREIAMTSMGLFQIIAYFLILLAITKPMGVYMTRVFNGEADFPAPAAALARSSDLQIERGPRRRRAKVDTIRRGVALLQRLRISSGIFSATCASIPAAQSAEFRDAECYARPGLQHGHQFRH